MQKPTLGTYLLSIALAGVGGWAVSQALQHDEHASYPVSAVPPTISVTIASPGARPRSVSGAPHGRPAAVRTSHDVNASRGDARIATGRASVRAVTRAATSSASGTVSGTRALGTLLRPTPRSSRSYGVTATNGAIVYIGDNGHLVANTGATSTSGVVALGVTGSDLGSGASHGPSTLPNRADSNLGARSPATPYSHANGSFQVVGAAHGGYQSVAMSGFEDHSVSVIGDDQITTYDDSNVFINRDGKINANTGDTDSSGLNAVDVTGSHVRSGNSGDSEGGAIDDGEDGDTDDNGDGARSTTPTAIGSRVSAPVSAPASDGTSVLRSGTTSRGSAPATAPSTASVTDDGASTASGRSSLVVGADGYDDVSIRTQGNRDITSYDDSNVVIGGHGDVNAQIGDSDTGGAVVMGIHDSDMRAGCEGDLCSPEDGG